MLSTRTVLKENDVYLVADAHYRVSGAEAGVYRRDTRSLSRYLWTLDGQSPQFLLQHERYPFWLHEQAANADVGYTMKLGVSRDLQVHAGGLHDHLSVTRYAGAGPHQLALEIAADFADMFEVRGWPGGIGPRAVHAEASPGGVTFTYTALDGLRCRTTVQASPVPVWTGTHLEWTLDGDVTAIDVRVSLLEGDEVPTPGDPLALATEYDALQARVGAALNLPDPLDQRVLEQSVADLRSLSFNTEAGPFPAAGLPWFVAPFGRDSMIIALMVKDHLPELAITVARYLAAHQGRRHDPQTL
ncbi:glycogen debranching N-terminal domain-containing protein, partial [Deinococcus sp.]|uniref:glycogen debranching N-terminal domain-containing protein n=1 Tax=Deinococcus sp. TaxID=47478 RepID=UPI002869A62E